MSITSIYEPIQDGLKLVEERLKSCVPVERPWVAEPLGYVLESSGKRVRPGLTLLAGRFYKYNLDSLVPMAAAIELFHNATLVHDDAVDNALTRRGKEAVNRRWGEDIAMLLGGMQHRELKGYAAFRSNADRDIRRAAEGNLHCIQLASDP